jgi:molybdopterin molybdotransferase
MAASPQSLVLSFEDARRAVREQAARVSPCGADTVDLLDAARRVLAEDIDSDRDIPPFPRSTRDGYAVHASDLTTLPTRLKVVGEIKAGPLPRHDSFPLKHGEAFSIMTGAPVPQGADAVVMVEFTSLEGEFVEINKSAALGEHIVAQGAEARGGRRLLNRGTRLNEAGIALAASVGRSRLNVFVRPQIAVLTTGDEIVEVDAEIGAAQIRNSNSYSLAVQILESGGDPVLMPIAPDEPQKLRELMQQGLQSDLLVMTGGVSMGRYDLVEQVLADLQAEFFFTGARIQPGRPVVFGQVAGAASASADAGHAHDREGDSNPVSRKYFFGLPGNPVSTMVTFELFARPMIEALAGMCPSSLAFLHARLKSEVQVKTGLTRFLPAILSGEYERSQVELVPWQGSGDIAAQARANCYIVVPPDQERIPAGEWVAVMLKST